MKTYPNGNPIPGQVLEAHHELKGADPRKLSVSDFARLGHAKRPLLKVIRQNCIECCGGSHADVAQCAITQCPFWPYRMDANPFNTRDLTDDQREAIGARLKQAR